MTPRCFLALRICRSRAPFRPHPRRSSPSSQLRRPFPISASSPSLASSSSPAAFLTAPAALLRVCAACSSGVERGACSSGVERAACSSGVERGAADSACSVPVSTHSSSSAVMSEHNEACSASSCSSEEQKEAERTPRSSQFSEQLEDAALDAALTRRTLEEASRTAGTARDAWMQGRVGGEGRSGQCSWLALKGARCCSATRERDASWNAAVACL
eukprot:3814455-Rhodomonas_salina.1